MLGNLLQRLSHVSVLFPPDVFERHVLVTRNITASDNVLDVGGELGNLRKFTKARVTVADINQGDIRYDGKKLPLKDRSFDVVTSIDVLEHVPKANKRDFIDELWRVTNKRLVMSFPLGTNGHMQAEKETLTKQNKLGKSVPYLSEHVKNGLPSIEEVKEMLPQEPSDVWFVGDWRFSAFLFNLHQSDIKIPLVREVWFMIKLAIYGILNLIFLFWHDKAKHEFTNRAYVIINKKCV